MNGSLTWDQQKTKLVTSWWQVDFRLHVKSALSVAGQVSKRQLGCRLAVKAVWDVLPSGGAHLWGHTATLAKVSRRKGSRNAATGRAVNFPPKAGPKSSTNLTWWW